MTHTVRDVTGPTRRDFLVQTGATGGAVTLQWAQNTASGTTSAAENASTISAPIKTRMRDSAGVPRG